MATFTESIEAELANFSEGLEAQFKAEAKAYADGQELLLGVLKDEAIVPRVQIQTVEKAMGLHWQLTDYHAKDGTVRLRRKDFTMIVAEDGTYKRFTS
jgi:hypothetical protein